MRNIAKTFFYIMGSLLLFISCKGNKEVYQQETTFSREDFITKELTGKTVEFDEPIMKPRQIMVLDTLLITCDKGTKKHFQLFSLVNKKKIGERIMIGQGPEEMIMPSFINGQDSIRLYDMATSTVFSYSIPEFTLNADPIPARRYQLKESYIFSELAELSNGQLVASTNKPEAPCYLFDKQGEKVKNLGEYPVGPEKYTDIERADAYRAILTSNNKDKIAVCHFFTDLIDIYNKEGKLEKRLFGPDHFYTRFTEYHDGKRIGSKPDPNNYRDAFYSPVSVDEHFFVLYNGKKVNGTDYNLLAKDIFVFDWNGTPKVHYKLDQGVSRITVDAQKHKIYGISDKPEFHIVEFSFDI